MSGLLLWIGLTIILALPLLGFSGLGMIGAVLMVIGAIIMIFEFIKARN